VSNYLSTNVLARNLLLGMCERVRTRNTLYEVGAAKSKIWHNAVEGEKDEENRKEKYDKMQYNDNHKI